MSQIDKAINILIKHDAINSLKLLLTKSILMRIRNNKNNEVFNFKNFLNCHLNFSREPVHIIREMCLDFKQQTNDEYFNDKITPILNDRDFFEKNPQSFFNEPDQVYFYSELSDEDLIKAEEKEKDLLKAFENKDKKRIFMSQVETNRIGSHLIMGKQNLKQYLTQFNDSLDEGLKGYRKRMILDFIDEGLVDKKSNQKTLKAPEYYDREKCKLILSSLWGDNFFEEEDLSSPIIECSVISFEWNKASYILLFQDNYTEFRIGKEKKKNFDDFDDFDDRPIKNVYRNTNFKLFYNDDEVLVAKFSNPDQINLKNKNRLKDSVFNKDNIKKIKLKNWVKDLKVINDDLDSLLENYRNNEIDNSIEIDLGDFDNKF